MEGDTEHPEGLPNEHPTRKPPIIVGIGASAGGLNALKALFGHLEKRLEAQASEKDDERDARAGARHDLPLPDRDQPGLPQHAGEPAGQPAAQHAGPGAERAVRDLDGAANPFIAADVAFVVVVHLSPRHESHLAAILQPHCPLPVRQVADTTPLEGGCVYVIPPGANLNAIDTHLRLSDLEADRAERAQIDHFFRTLADTHDGSSVGIVLSGTGTDGTLGLRRIKERRGLTIVQDPAEAEHDGMPRSAIASGVADVVLPVAEMAGAIARFAATRPRLRIAQAHDEADAEGDRREQNRLLHKIYAHLRARTGHDFSNYKQSTILRRIARRMTLHGVDTLGAYLEVLREQPKEVTDLFADLLITVTEFFRDKKVFERLENQVVPELFRKAGRDRSGQPFHQPGDQPSDQPSGQPSGRPGDQPAGQDPAEQGGPLAVARGGRVRVWSVGCSTGEEAYSLAMLLLEAADGRPRPPQIQVLATDLHPSALAYAREGLYPAEIAQQVSAARLQRFFTEEDAHYRVKREVREMVVFAPHNLLGDPPFSHIDLIVCRNLLIYLQRDVQEDVMSIFHYALEPDGTLLLGGSETIDRSDLFACVDKDTCLYRKRNVPGRNVHLPAFPMAPSARRLLGLAGPGGGDGGTGAQGGHGLLAGHGSRATFGGIHAQMVEQHAPPSVLLNPEHEVVRTSASAGRYLIVPGGERTHNVFRLLREPLAIELRAALHGMDRAVGRWSGDPREGKGQGDPRTADAAGAGQRAPDSPDSPDSPDARDTSDSSDSSDTGRPRAPVEAVCTKPVMVSLDGHLRHVAMWVTPARDADLAGYTLVTFEERAPTPKPAPHDRGQAGPGGEADAGPAGEELTTANATIAELRAELDMNRHRLRGVIEEYETSREEMQASNEELQSANEELRSTLEELETSKQELQSMNEELATINQENRHRVEELGQVSDDLQNLFAATDIAMMFLDRQLRIVRFTPKISELFNIREGDRGRPLSDLTHHLGYDELDADARRVLTKLTPIERAVEAHAGKHYLARLLPYRAAEDRIGGVVITFIDVTSLKAAEQALRQSEEQYRLLVESAREYAMLMIDPEGRITSWNSGAQRVFGYTAEEIRGRWADVIFTEEDRAAGVPEREMATALREGSAADDRWHQRKDGSRFWANGVMTPLHEDAQGTGHRGFVKVLRDKTHKKAQEDQLKTIMAELNHRVKNTLAVVQSIASQTSRTAPDLKTFTRSFERRLRSMASAHGLLTRTSWSGVPLADIIESELGPGPPGRLGDQGAPNVEAAGPEVFLRPAVALPMQMVIHELATNAHKYGCLCQDEGALRIRWEVKDQGQNQNQNQDQDQGQGATLHFEWAEHCPEGVGEPGPPGYGTKLVEQLIGYELRGQVQRQFGEKGLRCRLRVPLDEPPRGGRAGDPHAARARAAAAQPAGAQGHAGPPSILLVEDMAMLATAMKHELEHLGFMVVGPAQSVQRARTLIAGDPPDVAVLDISLGDEEVYPLIPELEAAGVPIVLLSGHDLASLPAEVGHLPVLAKPVEVEDLKRFLLEHCPGASARD